MQQRWLAALNDQEARSLDWDWRFWGRPQQLPPEWKWRIWLLLAGRGFGKTRTGAEWVRKRVEKHGARHIALIGATAADVRDVMVEGPAGILAVSPPWFMPVYEPSKRRLTWPNGARATTYSADRPDRVRGGNNDTVWADELASWRYPDAWDQLMLTLRNKQADVRAVVTTTPRPILLVKKLFARRHNLPPGEDGKRDVHLTTGSTYDNAENLAEPFLETILGEYEGTNLGRQEIYAEILEEMEGALWSLKLIEETRYRGSIEDLQLARVVVAIDPAITSGSESAETGIIGAGRGAGGNDAHGYVLDDRSGRYPPAVWARKALDLAAELSADCIVAEANQGGEMVEWTLRSALRPGERIPRVVLVRASRGKWTRAEPFAAMYEQKRVHHVGCLGKLEDQMCSYVPGVTEISPDRMDALVWALADLFPNRGQARAYGPEDRPEGM